MRSIDATHFLMGVRYRDKITPADARAFPLCLPAVRQIEDIVLHEGVTFFVGENGSGKSTVLEAMALLMGCNPEGGSENFNFATAPAHTDLHDRLRPLRTTRRPRTKFFLRAESYFNVATQIDALDAEPMGGPPIIASYGGVSLHKQSHGESFMALMMNRFGNEGLYFLDEPEAALSPTRQLAMMARMHDLTKAGSQFIIATHSPILLAYPHAKIFAFNSDGVSPCAYEETEHFQVTKDFLTNYQKRLTDLLTG